MNKVNELAVAKKEYETQEEFRERLLTAVETIIKSGYICTVREDETDIVIIEYNYADQSFGTPYPYWMTPEQYDYMPTNENNDEY